METCWLHITLFTWKVFALASLLSNKGSGACDVVAGVLGISM